MSPKKCTIRCLAGSWEAKMNLEEVYAKIWYLAPLLLFCIMFLVRILRRLAVRIVRGGEKDGRPRR